VSDERVRDALRSGALLVAVEAPAGCGKTYQGADYAGEVAASGKSRLLILTHTHAACSVFAEHTGAGRSRVEIRTIDSLIGQIAAAYHAGLGLPNDVASWARCNKDGYAHVALKVADLIERHPAIPASLARRYPVVICDEHQDSSGDQHAVAMSLLSQGVRLRIFADPMQCIFKEDPLSGSRSACDWASLTGTADAFEQLGTPHRWSAGCPELGKWVLKARDTLKSGGKINLSANLPPSVGVVIAENQAKRNLEYQLSPNDRKAVDEFEKAQASLLVLTHYNEAARSFRAFFNRRIPLWEGHTRPALETLADSVRATAGDASAVAAAVVKFMNGIGKGFSASAFGDRFEREVRERCTAKSRGMPGAIQNLARCLLAEPNHRGVAAVLRRLAELKQSDAGFSDIEMDCNREFWDAVNLGAFDDVDQGLAQITNRRAHVMPKPPSRAISTIHKAKGLECGSVIVMPCDAKTFPDKFQSRCLMYVALSRAKDRLLLVVSRDMPSPLLSI
jgi:hypothetical protein